MARSSLTDLRIKKLRPDPKKRIALWDALLPGFGLRLSPRGTKTLILMYRFDNKLRRQTLGRYPILSLAEARQQAQAVLLKAKRGDDPSASVATVWMKNSFAGTLSRAIPCTT